MSKHTQGEWAVDASHRTRKGEAAKITIRAKYGKFAWVNIGRMFFANESQHSGKYYRITEEEGLANAALVAAAPDMLAALQAHDAYMSEHFNEGTDSTALHPTAAANWKRVRAAIAKATA